MCVLPVRRDPPLHVSRDRAVRDLRERLVTDDRALATLSRDGRSLQPGDLDADRWWDQLTDEELALAYAERLGRNIVIDGDGARRAGAHEAGDG